MSDATVTSIALSPATSSIAAGATQQFTATATYSSGATADVTSSTTWASSSSTTASISASGLATAVAAGTAMVTATFSGVTAASALTVTAAQKTLSSIAVTPSSASVTAGATQQFTATATYSDGSTANIGNSATWTSSATTAATVNATGLATGLAAGTSTITAAVGSLNGAAVLSVTAAPVTLTSIAVTPAVASVAAGLTQQFAATATYSDGSTANLSSTVTWTSATPATATVNASGLATGVAAGTSTITAASGAVSGTAMLTVTPRTVSSIAVTPNPASFTKGATQQFAATATYSDGTTADVSSTVTWTAANTAVATIGSSGLATGVAVGQTSITAALGSISGSSATMVGIAAGTGVNVPTWHFDNNRSGLNAGETSLTPANVSAATFGKLFSYAVDGYVYGTPLVMSNTTVNGAMHNVLYVATENDSVYAFDADNRGSGAPLWKTSLLNPGETPLTDGPIQPYQGVTSTPVIDASSNTIYVVSAQHSSASGSSFRLNALDIATGAQKFGGPITINASVPATNSDSVKGLQTLTTSCIQRAALLLANGNVYLGFGSCHSGWLLAYDATTLGQVGVFNASPNLNGEGQYASAGGVWMGGGGPVADSSGNIYITTGNGPWDGKTAFADSVIKFSPTLSMEDYFTPDDYQYMDCADSDLAAGGLLMIPGTTQLLAGGKTGLMYMVNSGNMGKEQANDAGVTQEIFWGSGIISPYSSECTDTIAPNQMNTAAINSYEIFGTSAYFNGSVYLGVTPTGANVPSGIRQFTYAGGKLTAGAYTSQYTQRDTRGATPFVSANGAADGVLWMIDQGLPLQNTAGTPTAATLRAYDATNLTNELYNSSTNAADVPGYGIKFSSPVVVNGKVYLSTGHDLTTVSNPQGEIDVYGLN